MNQFIYFVTVLGNQDLLKKELELFHPHLKLSFSKKNFLTFKNTGRPYTKEKLEQLSFCFALDWGLNEGGITNDLIDSKLKICQFDDQPSEAPSRAYLKIKHGIEKSNIEIPSDANWIEFGCAPGGAIYYLLKNYNKVVGVDPAQMDQICLSNKNFIHIKKPIQNLTHSDLEGVDFHFVASDLNLNPNQAIKEVLRLSEKFKNLSAIFMTIKMVKTEHVELIPKFLRYFERHFEDVKQLQLASHKREFLIIAKN